jgi:hypothetical protein
VHLTRFERGYVKPVEGLAARAVLRVVAFLTAFWLDRELASGADPCARPVLAIRARRLASTRYRRCVARSVERLVSEFDDDRRWWLSAALPFSRHQLGEARETLLITASVLRTAERVAPRGVAMMLVLLKDPDRSPLYVPSAPGALQLRAHVALECLLGARLPRIEDWPSAPAMQGSRTG